MTWSPSRWSHEIESANWSHDAIALSICNSCPMWKPLFKWWNRWRFIKSPISAKTLISQGWKPGPSLGKELKRLRQEKLDNYKNSTYTNS
mgnify:CR=1 FL=1